MGNVNGELIYRKVSLEEVDRALFQDFSRYQVVNDCWRRENGEWVIRPDPFIDDWLEEDYEKLVLDMQNTLRTGGVLFGAFLAENGKEKLKGFVSVELGFIDPEEEYFDLSSLHISSDFRRRGAGKKLFALAADWAREQGAGKLYISAHSAAESQAFYRGRGCVDAVYIDRHHAEAEPFDCQLEYRLQK